jgi:4'-phosphopantetheinyl transferase
LDGADDFRPESKLHGSIIVALTQHTQRGSPAGFQLEAGAVHVWVADLDSKPSEGDLLSENERARADRFLHTRDGQRWSRAREIMRSLLGEYLRADPRALSFAASAHGKPELEGCPQSVCFNMSHSGGVAVYAVADQPVGVDVELEGRDIDVLSVAKRALGPTATARLSALSPEAREREFLREWVRHEAVVKCLGTGLGGKVEDEHGRRPWVCELELGPRWTAVGATASVAAMSEPNEMSCWEWHR